MATVISLEREWMKVYRRVLPKCFELLGGISGDRLQRASERAMAAADRAVLYFAAVGGRVCGDDPFLEAVELRVRWLEPDDPAFRSESALRARLAWKHASKEEREAVYRVLQDARPGESFDIFGVALKILGASGDGGR